MISEPQLRNIVKGKGSKFIRLSMYLRGINQIGQISKLYQSDLLLFCHDFTRNHIYNNYKYSSLIDSLSDLFTIKGISALTIARPYSQISPDKCYGNVFIVNGAFARARLADFILSRLAIIIPFLRSYTMSFQVRFWKLVLAKINPKIIIGIEPLKELCIAARTAKIPVFDMQHGIMVATPTAHFYRTELRYPDQKGWPDFVICRDEISFSWLKVNRGQYTVPLLVGHPWLSRFASSNDENDLVVKEAAGKLYANSDKPVIVYSLQHLRDANGYPSSYSHIPTILENFIKSESGKLYTWWFRLHPILLSEPNYSLVMKSLQEKFGNYSNVDWQGPTFAALPCVFKIASLHLTRDSSTTIEASLFGLPTGLLDVDENREILEEMYHNEIISGNASILSLTDPNALSLFIKNSVIRKSNSINLSELHKQEFRLLEFISDLSRYIKSKQRLNLNEILSDKFSEV